MAQFGQYSTCPDTIETIQMKWNFKNPHLTPPATSLSPVGDSASWSSWVQGATELIDTAVLLSCFCLAGGAHNAKTKVRGLIKYNPQNLAETYGVNFLSSCWPTARHKSNIYDIKCHFLSSKEKKCGLYRILRRRHCSVVSLEREFILRIETLKSPTSKECLP